MLYIENILEEIYREDLAHKIRMDRYRNEDKTIDLELIRILMDTYFENYRQVTMEDYLDSFLSLDKCLDEMDRDRQFYYSRFLLYVAEMFLNDNSFIERDYIKVSRIYRMILEIKNPEIVPNAIVFRDYIFQTAIKSLVEDEFNMELETRNNRYLEEVRALDGLLELNYREIKTIIKELEKDSKSNRRTLYPLYISYNILQTNIYKDNPNKKDSANRHLRKNTEDYTQLLMLEDMEKLEVLGRFYEEDYGKLLKDYGNRYREIGDIS